MIRKALAIVAIAATLGCVVLWLATGRHYYTKYQVVETVAVEIDDDDPFAETGFYDSTDAGAPGNTQTVTRDSFHFGLLPTPSGLFDKHTISVISIAAPLWGLTVIALVAGRLYRRRHAEEPHSEAT